MSSKKIYIDMDDTYFDTEEYIRKLFDANGVKYDKNKTIFNQDIDIVGKDLLEMVFSDYSCIPKKTGVEECIELLESEYEIIFTSCYSSEEEKLAKEKYADSIGKKILLCEGLFKQDLDLHDGIVVDDRPLNLLYSGCDSSNQYLMYNPYMNQVDLKALVDFKGTIIFSLHDLCDRVMEVNVDGELREYICSRISKFCKGDRL